MPPVLLTGRELAERLGYPYPTVMGWQRDEVIPSIKTGHTIYFNLGRVIEALRDRQRAKAEEAIA